jgi:hypothetical protein
LPFFEVWEIGPGANKPVHRPEHLFIQPEILGVAFGSLLSPTTLQTLWARHSAYPSPTERTSLQFSTPKGYGFLVTAQDKSAKVVNDARQLSAEAALYRQNQGQIAVYVQVYE